MTRKKILGSHVKRLLSGVSDHGRRHLNEVETDLVQTNLLLEEAIDKLTGSFMAIHRTVDARQEAIDRLLEVAQDQIVTVDLETMTVTTPFQDRFTFDLDAFRRQCLMEGLDEVGLTLARDTQISKFEEAVASNRPWTTVESGYASIGVEGDRRT